MNQSFLAFTLIASSQLFTSALAADGIINFTGRLTESACEVASKNISVNMGSVTAAEAKIFHDEPLGRVSEFELVLNNCPANINVASIIIEGVAEPTNASLFALDNAGQPGVAKGIGISLFTLDSPGSMKPIVPNEVSQLTQPIDASPGNSNRIKFYADYFGLNIGSEFASGSANATMQFSVLYN
ncbi:fimbrial protein [Chania multitudinisentens]|nr:fimbrial protein [Chania multitudinisentens]